MVQSRPGGSVQRLRRRWSFADCVFDEANWSLTVDGERVRIESKPLEVLRALLLHVGNVVSKDELLDIIWGDVTVVEASLPTAVRKLRVAIRDGSEGRHIIETAAGIGYRFAAPVDLSESDTGAEPLDSPHTARRGFPLALLAIVGAVILAALAFATLRPSPPPATFTEAQIKNALRNLDVNAVERMIAAGWDAKTLIGDQKNDALNYVLEICQWNPGHDRQKLVVMARTLMEAGARFDRRNVWGDTAYSIAKAPRNCGPDHPVTQMIRRICSEGPSPLGDRCMASYELARGKHFVPVPSQAHVFTSREVSNVIRRLDVEEAEQMIAAGWKPDAPFDAAGDTALGFAAEICEWDPGHDRRRLILMARTLLDGGATLDRRNSFGDTAYSIAKAKRFCGPDHPLTQMFRRMCNSGPNPLRDGCMASYELARGVHFNSGVKPNS